MEMRSGFGTLLDHFDPQDPFMPAYRQFLKMVSKLRDVSQVRRHDVVENELEEEGKTLKRLTYQAHLDALSADERRRAASEPEPAGGKPRGRGRQLESLYGTVTLNRLGYGSEEAGAPTRYPLDEKLALPEEKYTHPLQRRAVEEARVMSMENAVARVDETTGGHIPKRQLEETMVRAAEDFEAFYLERSPDVANDAAAGGGARAAAAHGALDGRDGHQRHRRCPA